MINFDISFSHKFFNISITQWISYIPSNCHHNNIFRKLCLPEKLIMRTPLFLIIIRFGQILPHLVYRCDRTQSRPHGRIYWFAGAKALGESLFLFSGIVTSFLLLKKALVLVRLPVTVTIKFRNRGLLCPINAARL